MPRRIFVFWENPIFRDSVRLLLDHPDVEWVGASSDYAAAMEGVQDAKPDTLLIEGTDGQLPAAVIDLLEASDCSLRLIMFNLNDNRLSVYHFEQWLVADEGDLIRLVLR